MTIFVMDHRDGNRSTAQSLKHIHRVNLVWHNRGSAHQRAQVDRFPPQERGHNITRLHNANNLID